VPTTDNCWVAPGIKEAVDGVKAIDVSVGPVPLDEEADELPEDELPEDAPLELLELLEVDETPEDKALLDELEPPEELDPAEEFVLLLDDPPPPQPTNAPLSKAINTTLRASRTALTPVIMVLANDDIQ
jgi:hypothetical protein